MVKVLLVNPPFYRLLGSHYSGLPLGLAYLTASLVEAGHNAWIYNADDLPGQPYCSTREIYGNSQRAVETINNPDDPLWREIVDTILKETPDIVGWTCLAAGVQSVRLLSRLLREAGYRGEQWAGGPQVTLGADLPDVDWLCAGEGEVSATSRLAGCACLSSLRIYDLDILPLPERNRCIPTSQSDNHYVITARGCPHRCRFCASPAIWQGKVTLRSIESIRCELRTLTDGTPIYFVDDTFTMQPGRAMQIMEAAKEAGVKWLCDTRADRITMRLAHMMLDSGCIRVKVGVESGSNRVLRAMNKGEGKDDILRGVGILRSCAIPVTAYLMAGFPGETEADLEQTIDFAGRLGADHYSLSVYSPYEVEWGRSFHQSRAMLVGRYSAELIERFWALEQVGVLEQVA